MALVGTRVETMREGNTNLAVKTDILLDPETGLVVERKTVVASVQTEDGRTAVITGQKTTVACAVQVYKFYSVRSMLLLEVLMHIVLLAAPAFSCTAAER